MTRREGPSKRGDVGITVMMLLLDCLIVGWFLYAVGITGWADSYSPDGEPEAPGAAREAMWFLLAATVITGGGLLALRARIAGTVQLIVLGGCAALFAVASAR